MRLCQPSRCHTVDIPKLNFSGRKPLLLGIVEQGSTSPDVQTFKILKPTGIRFTGKNASAITKPANLTKFSLAKVEEGTLQPGVVKVTLNHKQISPHQVGRQVLPL
ncbi:hypothetical protein T05_5554 [Trichinella murrelli]|uniref:Uncharacterized protein n=1 Tax=Trichinella murrelli TaxID=144512 RepID=A0A0V0TDV6_9BILA|nr:hypothetical protein T05_5554 [Trichinella murrelli]